MPLLTGSFPIQLQNLIDEARYRRQLETRASRLLPQLRNRAPNCFPHHAPMHSKLVGNSGDRAYAELVLSTDLLEPLPLRSPIQRVTPTRAAARFRVSVRLDGGPKHNAVP